MSFKRLSIVTVFLLVAFLLLFSPSPAPFSKTSMTVSQVLAAADITKRVKELIIQDQKIDLNNPDTPININLQGDPSIAQNLSIPITIIYDDDTTRYLAYTFNYLPDRQAGVPPPTPEPVPQTCDYEEEASSCPNGGLQTCTGIEKEEDGEIKCKYDGAVDPNCRNIRCNEPSGESQPPPPPEPSCDENVYYCEDGTTIHKYGGYWDGNECQYYTDRLEPC